MLIIEVACRLSAVAKSGKDTAQQLHGRLTSAPRLRVPRDGRGSPWKLRLLFAILLISLVCLFALPGCASLDVGESNAALSASKVGVHRQSMANLPIMIRTLDADRRFSQLPSTMVAQRLHALRAGEPVNILALSCGAGAGAFGAGAVAGLTSSGSRPDFTVVTGVSAGALIAPYAFLGPSWDARLLAAFANGPGEGFLQPRGLGAIFGSSMYSGAPLKQLVDAYVSDEMIRAVAREADRGRLLLVATTNLATGEPVLWDLGAIAKNGGPDARTLFRDVLLASASIPGLFPPVMIRVREDRAAHDEAHVDGAATMPFFVPPAFEQTTPGALAGTQVAGTQAGTAPGTARTAAPTSVYVIIDGPLDETVQATRLTAHAIFSRSVDVGLNHMLLTTLELAAATAQLQGATLQYSAIPAAYPLPDGFDFNPQTMRPLLHYAYECAQAGRFWTAFRRADDDRDTAAGGEETHKVPCPADDAFVRFFASR